MKFLQLIAALAVISSGLTSCQKEIDIKPNAFTQKYVIEGSITDAPGPYTVQITRTRSVTDDNSFEAVPGAQVVITDVTGGVVDTLQYTADGRYETSKILGAAGHEYQLLVRAGEETFTASSMIPGAAVAIDSVYVSKSEFGEDYFATPVFTDPAGRGNYYRMLQWVNNKLIKGYWLRNDNARDGQTYTSALRYDVDEGSPNPKIANGDSIRIELQSISKQTYDYYRTLEDVTGYSFTTPANPISNIKGGALGVFSTGLSRTKAIKASF